MKKKKIRELTEEFLKEVGLDPSGERFRKTPERVSQMLCDIFSSTHCDLAKEVQVFKTDVRNENILVKNIPFYSFCEHHLLPFFGRIHISYIPKDGLIIGFSGFVTIVRALSRRLQLQERLTDEIADKVMSILQPHGVMVVVEARHLCVEMREERPQGTEFTTYSVRGKMETQEIAQNIKFLIGSDRDI
jgi:GTP cyclohydrolase I